MNFIRHIRTAFELLATHADATPYHVSLYVALFSQWNDERFPESLMLVRGEVMRAAHIGSPSTYLKCLRELTAYGLITYQPSKSEHRPSRCLMHELQPDQLAPEVAQALNSNEFTARTKSVASTSTRSGASTGASRGQAVVSFDKQVETVVNKNKPVLSIKLDEAVAEKKIGEELTSAEQLLEPDDSELTAPESPPKAKVARKGKAPTTRRPPHPEIPFAESNLADLSAFIAAFAGTDYALADLRFYHEKILNWRQKGEVPRRRDWLATSKQFFLNDAAANRLKLAPGVQSHQPGATYADTGIPTTGYRSTRWD
ncbi:hypothetical protein Q3A66_07175 [Hymenobacter sp. BT770]|uniref:hypothetical protein n=1 Tax=Hymenobacter sp. BT770 TaxID=2886942 RepID=UPI001D119493|nr:hypothetical protein [Hymenobacter sp. BT770]MCC3152771.1 hypothetical protein [Hymenobacter sp. BT770]MDO3414846.1 hypothetical protein [Hymenobacter sp. BT770]